jgi:hypothetical protein
MIAMNAATTKMLLQERLSQCRKRRIRTRQEEEEYTLEVDLLDDPLRHILVIPGPPVDFLKLNAMHAEQRDLDDENFKPQSRAGAEVALDVCAGFTGCALV